jgi:hypothetical protein
MANRKSALQFPERVRLRLVQMVPAGTPGAYVDPIFGYSWITSASKGLNGTGGFQQVEQDPVLNDSSEMTVQLPPVGSDGRNNVDRLYYYSDTPDPDGSGQVFGYMPGDEYIEVIRGQNELVQTGTPVSETTTQDALSIVCRDVTEIFKKTRETASGFWNHAPRDVFEFYTRAWQGIVSDDFDDSAPWAHQPYLGSGVYSTSDGAWAWYGGAALDGNSNVVLTIPTGATGAYLYAYDGSTSSWPLTDAGMADHSCWRMECSISAASFLAAAPTVCFGVGDATSAIPGTLANAGLGVYTIQLVPETGDVYAVTIDPGAIDPSLALWRSWPANATALLDAANQFAPPYTLAIEARERWVYYYLDGQLIAVSPRVSFPTTHHDARPFVYVGGSPGDSVSVDYIVVRRTTPPLNGGQSGDYFLPSPPSSGGLQGEYYDTSLASVGTPDTGVASGQYGAVPPTLNPSAVRVDTGLLFDSAAGTLPVPSGISISSSNYGSGFTDGETVYYKLTAFNSNGETTASTEVEVASPGPLSAPTQAVVSYPAAGNTGSSRLCFWVVTAYVAGGGETTVSNAEGSNNIANTVVLLSWSAVPGAVGYNIYLAYDSPTNPYYLCDSVFASQTSVEIGGYGEQITSSPAPTANTTGNFIPTLTWGAVSGAIGYKIYRSTTSGSEKYLTDQPSATFTDRNVSSTTSASPPGTNTATAAAGAPGWLPNALGNALSAYVRWTGAIYLNLSSGSPVVLKLAALNVSQAMWVGKTRVGESILCSSATLPAYSTTVLADNPYCYFQMGETSGTSMFDRAGNVEDAVYSGAVNGSGTHVLSLTESITGDTATCIGFGNTPPGETANAYAYLGSAAEAAFTTCSVEFWASVNGFPDTGDLSGIVVKQDAWGVFLNDTTFCVYDFATNTQYNTSAAPGYETFHHVVLRFDSGVTNGSSLYIDGALAWTGTLGVVDVAAQSLGFATGEPSTVIQSFAGDLGEVAIYPYLLSVAQISHHYNAAHETIGDYTSETLRGTSPDLRTALGDTDGWYPLVFEYIYHSQDSGLSTTVGFTDSSGDVCSSTSLAPYGCFTQQVTPQDSYFDTLQSTIGESFAYQWKSVPMALESGYFPGAVIPQARVGRDTDYILDGTNAANPQETSTAEDNAMTDLASAQGLGGSNTGSLTAEAFDFDILKAHSYVLSESESLPATTEMSLLVLQLETLLEFRSEAWQQITSDASAPRSMQDTWPLSQQLAEFDWQPGDGLRVQMPEIFIKDITPRQLMSLTRIWYRDGIGQTSVSFRDRQRNFEFAMRRFIRQFTSDRRQFQGQLVERTGTQVLAPAYSTVPLPVDLATVRQATLTILSKSDQVTSFAVEVNGQDTGQTVLTTGVLDISNAVGRNNAVEPQMVVRLTTSSSVTCTVGYVVSLLVLVGSG